MPLRLVFMGTPDFAVPTLIEIIGHGHEIGAVYTRAPKPAGRGMDLQPSPIEREGRRFGVPVLTPKTLKTSEAQQAFSAHRADAAVVVAYGLILPRPILDAVPLGCFNLHASALPRWRGAAPINRAVMAGDTETAAAVMRMDEGLDTGPVAMTERVPIGADMTAGELHDQLARLGADLMVRALAALERGSIDAYPQNEGGATYAKKIAKEEAHIAWAKPARAIDCLIRGLSPSPGAWCEFRGERLKILYAEPVEGRGAPGEVLDGSLTIACGDGALRLKRVQRAGRAPTEAAEFLRGFPLKPGDRL
jgi:methionyl-tRNA formyltransferase